MQTIQRVVSVALITFAAIALVAPRAEAFAAKINADVRANLDQFFRQTPGRALVKPCNWVNGLFRVGTRQNSKLGLDSG